LTRPFADSTGAVLPGVTVDINGPQKQTAVTDSTGEAHFLNLSPGTYTVSAKLAGFGDYLNKNISVATGSSVPLRISLSIAGVAAQVQVTSESPVVDTKKMGRRRTSASKSSRTSPRRATRGSCCRRFPASSWIA
jgi:uncharacterized membrane protein YvbJ